jgi:O-antigen/teichoic acid export membrane protein
VLITLSFFLRDFFQTHSLTPFIIFGIGMPIYLLMSINRGILQGLGNYKKLAISYQVEMWVRLILSVALVSVGLGVNGVALGLTGSLIATLLVTAYRIPTVEKQDFDTQAIKRFLAMILLYEFSQILINNSDTILVKHYFPPHEAGLYAALALIGRIVYFGTWTIVTLLFPTVIKLEKEGKNHLPLFMGGLGVVALMATGIIGACYWFPDWIVLGLFGKAYLSITVYLWYYALATALFACANVFVYYNLSLERRFPVWLTLVGGCSQVALLALFHDNFMQVINLQIYVMLALFGAMVCYQITVTKISIATSLQG